MVLAHRLSCLILLLWGMFVPSQAAEGGSAAKQFHPVGVEVQWQWGGVPLVFGEAIGVQGWQIRRADFLMSELALQRQDGTWLESSDWFACFRGADGKARALLEGVPAQVYQGIRFKIGLGEKVDRTDPNHWPPGHALHPSVNGLHWGWQGGYIFLALEGHFPKADTTSGGFSYHLAGPSRPMKIELNGPVDLRSGGTISLNFNLEKILGGLNPVEFGESTHSREGDPRAAELKGRAERAFSLSGVMPDLWQESVTTAAPGNAPQSGTTMVMHISKRLPQVTLPAGNLPTLEGVALGQRLFHETRLSLNNKQACASCHQADAAFTDAGRRFSLGVDGREGLRNTMPLFNLAWQEEFFWDGRIKGLRHQVLLPIQDPVEMHESLSGVVEKLSGDASYAEGFRKAFGSSGITPERLGLALEQYLLTLISQDSKFDRALQGREKLTPAEQRGLELFVTEHDPARNLRGADCFHCHGGALFTNQGFANNGLDATPEPGRQRVTGKAGDLGKFRVPSLRNTALTGPYMHDGRFSTLEQVIDHYDHGVQRTATLDPNLSKHPTAGLGLTREDKSALIAFLEALTDNSLFQNSPVSADFTISKP
jgi:cytochrome c peroxidase